MGAARIGTSSWTDPTLLASGWYPAEANTPEERLRHYASNFDLVEVDSTYYGLPSERNAALWVERTPKDFRFDVKAFSLMTGHPTATKALPKAIRDDAPKDKRRVYPKDLPSDALDEVWETFRKALMPLHSAGKLGLVMLQYPKWFVPGRGAREEILAARDRLPDFDIAVELRRSDWFSDERSASRTLDFFRSEALPFVCVDMPQGFRSSIPPFAEATSERFAVVRFHGRRAETWEKPGVPVVERFRYDYSDEELREWAPRVAALEEKTKETHALFNNCYRDYGVRNAKTFADLLEPTEADA